NEPQTLTTRVSIGGGRLAQGLFNAGLTELDLQDVPHPYLAQDLPRLGTESWQVFADGRMETTYRLRPGLVWHDGTLVSAGDFVFTQRAITDPLSQVFPKVDRPSQLEAIVAVAPQTLVFRWKGPDREAGQQLFQPLPEHLLGADFDRGDPAGFANLAYWT